MKKGVAIDMNDLEAQFLRSKEIKPKTPAFVVGFDEEEDEEGDEIIEFNDNEIDINESLPKSKKSFITKATSSSSVPIPAKKTFSYASATEGSPSKSSLTVEELEAQLISGMLISPKSPVSQLIGAGPPPGLPPGLSSNSTSKQSDVYDTLTSTILKTISSNSNFMSSIAPLSKNDPNKEFMNRFERNLIMKIHTTQLTTETPLMDDFYYQALSKKKKSESGANGGTAGPNGQLLYFPLPSAAERQKELQRRERRKKLREKAQERDGDNASNINSTTINPTNNKESEISAELVLGKVSHSTSRKPRQQLKLPTNFDSSLSSTTGTASSSTTQTSTTSTPTSSKSFSLHENVIKGIEQVYTSIISIEDFYLKKEEQQENNLQLMSSSDNLEVVSLTTLANEVILNELNLNNTFEGPNHIFIHFLTIPKGRSIISKALKVLNYEGKVKFFKNLVEYFDFMEIVRPETSLNVIDSFISQVLSPLVSFVGEADWSVVMESLMTLFGKRSFVWIALTKSGMVLLCILLSRLEILKGEAVDSDINSSDSITAAAVLTEKIYDSLEGHLLEFFSLSDPSRDFYAWQFLALLAMNVESDRKRSMILELRDKILLVVEEADEKSVKNLNVFLNALGLDASQLK